MRHYDFSAFTDIHSHLVPGVDDGARDLDDTLASVERMTRLGIRKILTTPHLNGSVTRDVEALEARLSEVDEAQMEIVTKAKDLADSGELVIAEGGGDDELIY